MMMMMMMMIYIYIYTLFKSYLCRIILNFLLCFDVIK